MWDARFHPYGDDETGLLKNRDSPVMPSASATATRSSVPLFLSVRERRKDDNEDDDDKERHSVI